MSKIGPGGEDRGGKSPVDAPKQSKEAALSGLMAALPPAEPTTGTPAGGRLPPVDRWDPPFCGDIDMRIARDGSWHYQGSPIGRERMVRLFSTILKREGDAYFLVTPVEKVGISVEDVPFIAVDFRIEGEGTGRRLVFVTNVGDEAVAGPEHPLRLAQDPVSGEPAPYVLVRRNLEARIDRKSFYRLVELGEEALIGGVSWFGLRSGGAFFALMPAAELG